MKTRYLYFGAAFILSACATQKMSKKYSFNLWEPSEMTRVPASRVVKRETVQISLEKVTTKLCGLDFDNIHATTTSSDFYVSQKTINDPSLAYRYSVPGDISFTSTKNRSIINLQITNSEVSISNPLFPQIPLLLLDKHPEICENVKKYHQNFMRNVGRIASSSKSKVINTTARGQEVRFMFRSDLTSTLENAAQKLENLEQKLSGASLNRTKPLPVPKSLIIFDDLYEEEVSELASIYSSTGQSVVLMKLSRIPGLDANGPVPTECQGERLRECYHVWGDPMEGVSPFAVPSMKGFFAQTSIATRYEKVSYIPGLIRAYIRSMNKVAPLKGVFLVGNHDVIAPFYTTQNRYGSLQLYEKKLSTDSFYGFPNPVLQAVAVPHFEETSPWLLTCLNLSSGVKTLRQWCEEGETRFWPDLALTAYRFPAVTPHSRVMKFKLLTSGKGPIEPGSDPVQSTEVSLDEIVPVGRLYTRHDLDGEKDPIVHEYVAKVLRWHENLPSISGNSVASHGGGDDYAFEQTEVDQFQLTFGTKSKIYASKHLIEGSKCNGRCEYVPNEDVQLSYQAPVNKAALLFTAHGGAFGYQGPYPAYTGIQTSDTWSEAIRRIPYGEDLQALGVTAPEFATLKYMEEGTLFGTVVANSCHINDFPFLENEIHTLANNNFKNTDQITIGQQFLQVPNGGALNGFFNVDVGWAGSDSFYNAKIMQKMKIAHDNCGDVGEALRLTWQDMANGQTNGAWDFHVMNRQLLGSPFNPIARKPAACKPEEVSNREVINEL